MLGILFLFLYPFVLFATSVSLQSLILFFTTYPLFDLIRNSLHIALLSSVGSLFLGLLCVYSVVQCKNKNIKRVMQLVVLFPLLLSSVGIAIVFRCAAHIFMSHMISMIAITHMLLNYPLVYRMTHDYWQIFPQGLLEHAQGIGASGLQLMRTIIIPYMRPVLAKSWMFVFALSLVESGGASFVISKKPFTIPLALKVCIKQNDMTGAVALSLVLVFLIECIGLEVLFEI